MAFTYDITTNRGKVRLLIGDNVLATYHFEDDEIDAFLTMASSSIYLAAAMALEAWAATETSTLDSERIGDYQFTRGAVNKKITLAKEYRTIDSETPYLTWSEFDLTGEEE